MIVHSRSSAAALRRGLSERAAIFAHSQKLRHVVSDGSSPTIVFGPDEQRRHGNFHPASFRRILMEPAWAQRLQKVHTSSRKMLARSDWQWRELDCACSSDALLMNIFCHPDTLRAGRLDNLLLLSPNQEPVFGYRPRIPLRRGLLDQTEIDMKLDDLLVEAKLTESNFQFASIQKLSRYQDLEFVFEAAATLNNSLRSRTSAALVGYQVIRGVLAAHASAGRFCLFCDSRRPDLIETWFAVMHRIRDINLRCRILLLTWQELSAYLPHSLQHFLESKYGIIPV